MQETNRKTIARLVKSRNPIILTNHLIKKVLGYDDLRDFTKDIGDWGYTTDFTYRDRLTTDWQKHLRQYLKDTYLD